MDDITELTRYYRQAQEINGDLARAQQELADMDASIKSLARADPETLLAQTDILEERENVANQVDTLIDDMHEAKETYDLARSMFSDSTNNS